MYGFLTFSTAILVVIGSWLLLLSVLTYTGLVQAFVRAGLLVENHTDRVAEEALSQSLLVFFFAFVAYRVRKNLRRMYEPQDQE